MYNEKRSTDAAALASSYASFGAFTAAGAVDQERWDALFSVAFADGTPATSQLPVSVLRTTTQANKPGFMGNHIGTYATNKAAPNVQ